MISMDKQYRTRDGRAVRLYSVDNVQTTQQVHGAICDKSMWLIGWWHISGNTFSNSMSETDLIEVKPKQTLWLTVHSNHAGKRYYGVLEKEPARFTQEQCIAIVPVEFTEGEGL